MVLLGSAPGCFPALMTLAMSGATPEDAGLASGLVNTTAQVGGALGLAVLATLVGRAHRATLLADGQRTADALTGGYHLAFGIGAGLIAAAMAIALVLLRPARAERAASRTEVACSEA